MNNLHSKIEEAANLFQNHDFKKSLQLYDQCINICKKNQQSKTLLNNLLSSKGALMSILGDQKGALDTLDEVLKQDPYHALCLMRRSQVYKKKNKLNKALKDLKALGNFSPDNLQIAAMKVQIQNMKLKNKQVDSSSESESDSEKSDKSDDLDEEQLLNFSNLRMIDRKSVSIMIKPEARKSRVTIAGDIAIEYQATEDDTKDDKSFASTNVSKEYAREKYMKTFREIQMDEQQTRQSSNKSIENTIIKVKSTAPRTKSILKNRNSTIYVNTEEKPVEKQKKYGGRESKMIDLLKNIDGKVIAHAGSERSSMSVKEVQFRKSMFGGMEQLKALATQFSQAQQTNTKPKVARKSCLKRPSFEAPKIQPIKGKAEPRRSKFDSMSMKGIDGIVIRNHKVQNQKEENNRKESASDSDSDEGDEHNIFGNQKIEISKELRENLGLGEDSLNPKKKEAPKPRAPGGKSILKKSSVMIKNVDKNKEPSSSPFKQVKKAKKSVMFTKIQ